MPVSYLLAGLAFSLAVALPIIVVLKEGLVLLEIITAMTMREHCDDDNDEYE